MKPSFRLLLSALACFVLLASLAAQAEPPADRNIVVPDSSREAVTDVGHHAHTNHLILAQPLRATGAPSGVVPWEARAAYGLPAYALGDAAGSEAIAVVDAYDYPTALADFNAFSKKFGLPQESGDHAVLQVVYATGTRPKYNSGWSQEAALDIEWAHAMAPSAKIILVEAASTSYADLLSAVDVASALDCVHEVSMSWGGSEFKNEAGAAYDGHFSALNVVYFASSGDNGGQTCWPGVSPNAVSAGGTTLYLDTSGNFLSESGWNGSGGGKSVYEARPAYQDAIQSLVGTHRGAPDFSFDANPYTGVSVYWNGGWYVFGGTSVASPSLAGLVNLVASSGAGFATSTSDELGSRIYPNLGSTDFRDITVGSAGKLKCTTSWDFVTGVGSNWGLNGK